VPTVPDPIHSVWRSIVAVLLVCACASAQDEPIEQPNLAHIKARERTAPASTERIERSTWFQQVSAELERAESGASFFMGPAWSVESDQEYGTMGHAVASAGDVNGDGYSDVLVGALAYTNGQSQEGRAFLYLGSSAGLSSNAAWTAEGNQAAAFFGASLGTAGDVNGDGYSDVIVGSWSYDNQGAAFVYLGSSAGLSATPVATLEGGQANAVFGASVGTAGDVNGDGYSDVIVGAKYFSNGQSNEGKTFVFLGSSSGVNTSAVWTAELNQPNAYFGQAVGTAGDVNGDGYDDVLVGAPSYSNTLSGVGRAFLYLGSSAGIAANPAWSVTGNQLDEWLGYSLSTAGDVNADGYSDVIVGAPAYDNGELTEGAAFLFLGSSSGLVSVAAWSAEADHDGAFFGGSVGTAGDVNGDGYTDVIVGAESYTDGNVVGRASVYLGSSSGLATSAAWTAQGDQADALFGGAVATAGDVNGDGFSDAIIGARAYSNGQWSEGRAFVYRGASAGLATSAAWSGEGWQEFVGFGWSVACAGDVNGDGFSDVVVGAPGASDDQAFEGMAFLYLGSATGLSRTPSWQAEGDQVDSWFGYPVGTAGDVNGDGYSDVIVAAHRFDNGQTDEGRVFVYLGSSSGLSFTPAWTAECDQDGANFGYCAATAGDVNGDGFGDVIVGAANYDNAALNMGKAFVYLGSGTGLSAAADWSFEGNQANAFLGASVATAGDVNADGYSDVVVGASGANGGLFGTGTALVFLGSSAGLAASASWSADGSSPVGRFGYSVATAGDVNADGYSDVIIGAPGVRHAFEPVTNGEAFVYLGSSSGLSQSPVASLAGAILSAFGYFVATAGDVNSDGYSDVIVGAPTAWIQSVNDGYASVFLGSASGVSSASAWTVVGAGQSALLGAGLATAGDVNGDGYADVIVGELGYADDAGRARLFLGNEGRGGWTLAPQQHLADDSAPIDLLGASIDNQAFGIRLGLQHSLAGFAWATGRSSNVRLEWEVKPLDGALDGTSTETGPPSVAAGSPQFFDELARFHPTSGPQQRIALGPYHWRARIRTSNPLFPATRWVTVPWNNVTETKLTVPVNLPFSHERH
jgi:hypothetical protein